MRKFSNLCSSAQNLPTCASSPSPPQAQNDSPVVPAVCGHAGVALGFFLHFKAGEGRSYTGGCGPAKCSTKVQRRPTTEHPLHGAGSLIYRAEVIRGKRLIAKSRTTLPSRRQAAFKWQTVLIVLMTFRGHQTSMSARSLHRS